MNSTGRIVAKNASVLMLSQVITWALSLLVMVFLPRYLGPTGVGQIHLANSIWAVMAIFISFGMDTYLAKEIARSPTGTSELFYTSLVLRTIAYGVCFALVVVYTYLVGYAALTVYVILITGIAQIFAQYGSTCRASLQGLERMEFIARADIVSRAFGVLATIAVLLLGYGVIAAVLTGIGATLINLLLQFTNLRKFQKLQFQFKWPLFLKMAKGSIPYLLVNLFLVLYMQMDIVIISLLVDEKSVGWYGGADQLFGTLLFIPTVLITAVFPTLSRLYASKSDSLNRIMRKSFNLMLMLSVPIGFGLVAIANPSVVLLYGQDFANSGPVLALFGLVLIMTYQNMLLGQFLISTDRQNAWTWVMAVATIATIPLDLIFIPWCMQTFNNGAMGGALSFIVTETGMMVAGLSLLPKGALGRENIWLTVRVLISGLVMLAASWWLRHFFIAIPIFVGGIVYIALTLLLRVVPHDDWLILKDIGERLVVRFRSRPYQPASIPGEKSQ